MLIGFKHDKRKQPNILYTYSGADCQHDRLNVQSGNEDEIAILIV